jgi:hypothetical protein
MGVALWPSSRRRGEEWARPVLLNIPEQPGASSWSSGFRLLGLLPHPAFQRKAHFFSIMLCHGDDPTRRADPVRVRLIEAVDNRACRRGMRCVNSGVDQCRVRFRRAPPARAEVGQSRRAVRPANGPCPFADHRMMRQTLAHVGKIRSESAARWNCSARQDPEHKRPYAS